LDELLCRPRTSVSADGDRSGSSAADAAAIAAAKWQANQWDTHSCLSAASTDQASRWKQEGRRAQLDRLPCDMRSNSRLFPPEKKNASLNSNAILPAGGLPWMAGPWQSMPSRPLPTSFPFCLMANP